MPRNVVVTGAAYGLGKSIAECFLESGDRVFLVDRDSASLDETYAGLSAGLRENAVPISLDITDGPAIAGSLVPAVRDLGGVAVLVNNAATYPFVQEPLEADFDEHERAFRSTWEVNVVGTARMTHALLPMLIESGPAGRVINISSVVTFVGEPTTLLAYAASKGAIYAMTKVYARLLAPYHITCNTIAPGSFPTKAEEELTDAARREWDDTLMRLQVLPRRGRPSEIATACRFLASDEAAFMTGQCLSVDGGWTMR